MLQAEGHWWTKRQQMQDMMKMEAMMKMMTDMMKGQINELKQTMEATNKNLQNQIGQMANELNQMKFQQGSSNLRAQTVINLRNLSAITLR